MNAVDPQIREAARDEARAHRIEMYADWLAHDADGLTFNLLRPSSHPGAAAILAEARALVALTLSRIDLAIEADKKAHAEQESSK